MWFPVVVRWSSLFTLEWSIHSPCYSDSSVNNQNESSGSVRQWTWMLGRVTAEMPWRISEHCVKLMIVRVQSSCPKVRFQSCWCWWLVAGSDVHQSFHQIHSPSAPLTTTPAITSIISLSSVSTITTTTNLQQHSSLYVSLKPKFKTLLWNIDSYIL